MINLSKPDFKDNNKEFVELTAIIKKKIGFNCEQYKEAHLKRRLAVRLRANRSQSYKEYANVLIERDGELNKLRESLTIHVTELFRNPIVYDVFYKKVLPELFKNKKTKTIKIWSAGSSDGEEAYSIAILLREFLGKSAKLYNISILGTDIEDIVLRKGELGIYNSEQLKKISKQRLNKFFMKLDGDNYQVIDELRKQVRFKNHDLISGRKLSGFDIIFCRNVTIYFEQKLQEKLYLDFYNALNNRGYFVMGKTETLTKNVSSMFMPVDTKERIYMKQR